MVQCERARTVTPCSLFPPLPTLSCPSSGWFFFFFFFFLGLSLSLALLVAENDAEEMTALHVPLHTMLHLVLTAHGCQMTELKTNVGAVDDHELL